MGLRDFAFWVLALMIVMIHLGARLKGNTVVVEESYWYLTLFLFFLQ